MNSARVSIITVNYNKPHFIRHLLKGLEAARPALDFEYFVVDNASSDGSVTMIAEQFSWVKLIRSDKNLGFGGGNNLALRQAQGEYIFLCNPDLTLFPGELEKWVKAMDEHPDVGISSPRVLNPDGTDQISCYRFPTLFTPLLRRTFLGQLPYAREAVAGYTMSDMDRERAQDVDWVFGAAVLIRRDLLAKIGFFDERFFMYFEDADLCRRAWEAGSRVSYLPVSKVMHYHQRDSRVRKTLEFLALLTNSLARAHFLSGLKYFLKYFRKPNPRKISPGL